ncbi:hypothetical protein TNCT_538721 [Trichonephila clavata]|uniref:Uncharacterized protein n=1 Tax=Trichonephila clavata TaxID=2740835 RepID=A0A8X6KXN8_TRICU|nr:hypothetical protein TNCT_538721 [Trichonephila clavata]
MENGISNRYALIRRASTEKPNPYLSFLLFEMRFRADLSFPCILNADLLVFEARSEIEFFPVEALLFVVSISRFVQRLY